MSANVFVVIIPNQKKVVADLVAGRMPDPALGAQVRSARYTTTTDLACAAADGERALSHAVFRRHQGVAGDCIYRGRGRCDPSL